ncbi:hypothetical protein FQN57_007192 [Myotisia sp. PD_48]|nr:hypothetical protein FQN57_007192 [Myotisia sp. PD_48]
MNPRRSSRARPSQPGAAVSQHSNSSSSLNSLNRAERSTRSNNKPTPPGRSTAQRSQSTEEEEAASKNGVPQTRQRQRGREGTENTEVRLTGDEFDEEEADEEEVTRCICGHQDYPGLPLTSREIANRSSLKVPVKDELARDASAPGSDILSEDSGSLFIQCDSCKVWQHGGCVGILEESMSPDEYFCERCRKDLHKIIVGPHG